MTTTQAEARIIAAVPRQFQDRALDLFRSMAVSQSAATTISGLRIAGGWPLSGSITFTRDADQARVRLYLKRKPGQFGGTWKASAKIPQAV